MKFAVLHFTLVYWSYWYMGCTPHLQWKRKGIKRMSCTLYITVTAYLCVCVCFQELARERQENARLLKAHQDKDDLIGKLKEEIDLLNRVSTHCIIFCCRDWNFSVLLCFPVMVTNTWGCKSLSSNIFSRAPAALTLPLIKALHTC